MTYTEFKLQLQQSMEERFSPNTNIYLNSIQKNNGLILDALIIQEPGEIISPTLYINDFFKEYKDGTPFMEIVSELYNLYRKHKDDLEINPEMFQDFASMKDHIVYRLINYDKNEVLLHDVPYIPYLDLAIVFVCLVHTTEDMTGTILIRNSHMQHWEVDTKTLMQVANKNTPELLPYDLRNMGAWMEELVPEQDCNDIIPDLPLYVLTNARKLHGACCILYKELLKQVAENFSSDIIILPSSIHEVLLLPSYCSNTPEELNALVQHVNDEDVRDEEILSDHIYYYNRQLDQVSY